MLMSLRSVSIADVVHDPNEIQNFADSYNSRIDKVPKILKSILGSERVFIKISLSNGDVFRLGYETEKAKIVKIVEGGLKNPTIIVAATQSSIEKINSSKDPLAAFRKEMERGNFAIYGQTLATKAKLRAALASDSVLWFFYKILF
jgi:hypothetical protein